MSDIFEITLRKTSDSSRANVDLENPEGKIASQEFELPWIDALSWQAIFTSLELYDEDDTSWPQNTEVIKKSEELKLFTNGHPSRGRFKIIGEELYKVFGSHQVFSPFSKYEGSPVFEFHIPDEGSILQAYPWELLHDGQGFLFNSRQACLVRHVDCEAPLSEVDPQEILRVLAITPRPNDKEEQNASSILPMSEREVLSGLSNDWVYIDDLPSPTLDGIHRYFLKPDDINTILHIDTHGDYGWLCQCHILNSPNAKVCASCGNERTEEQKNQGYLEFEDPEGNGVWVSGEDLGKRLRDRNILLVVLSACKSGLVAGHSTYTSVAGSLIKQGVPAVLAMQFSIDVRESDKLTEILYDALFDGQSLVEATQEIRIGLGKSWYRPVLYLRTDCNNRLGRLFSSRPSGKVTRTSDARHNWITKLGFRVDPFKYPNAALDDNLSRYFYNAHGYTAMVGDISKPECTFVFGDSGAGKTSLRSALHETSTKDGGFSVVYHDFGELVAKFEGDSTITVRDHIAQILQNAFDVLIKEHFGKSESSSIEKVSKTIHETLWKYIETHEKDPVKKEKLHGIISSTGAQTDELLPEDDYEYFARFFRYVTELFGYTHVHILVDPDYDITPKSDDAWRILEPLLESYRLLEIPQQRLAFKFFLSNSLSKKVMGIKWIADREEEKFFPLRWTEEGLRELLADRLRRSSEGRYESLDQLSEVESLNDQVLELSRKNPRRLISICNRLFSAHTQSATGADGLRITQTEQEEVFALYQRQAKRLEVEQLISQGESSTLEFKSTMRWDVRESKRNNEMDKVISKTMCGFMNAKGGTLVIGVDDAGNALGLENDLSTLRKKDEDGFELALNDIIREYIGITLSNLVYTTFTDYQGKRICIIDIKKSPEPVFFKGDKGNEFYVRVGNSTRLLDSKETLDYSKNHFLSNEEAA